MVLLVGGLGAIQELEVNTKCWIQILRMYLTTSYALIFSVYFEIQFWLKLLGLKKHGKTYVKTCPQADHQSCVGLTTSKPSIVCGINKYLCQTAFDIGREEKYARNRNHNL
jgi:hypothetical protein